MDERTKKHTGNDKYAEVAKATAMAGVRGRGSGIGRAIVRVLIQLRR